MDARRILFVYVRGSTFVRTDVEILRTAFRVDEMRAASPLRPPPWVVAAAAASADLVFCWFASWHALLPLAVARATGRPSVVVVGGYDVAAMPEIAYGHQRGGLRKIAARSAMRSATRICAFSHAAKAEAERNAGVPPERVSMIHLGLATLGNEDVSTERAPLLLTVADVNRSNVRRKGLDRFARASRALPDHAFVLVGAIEDRDAAADLTRLGGPNLQLAGRLENDELTALRRRASAYLQLSMHEGFGLAVAEAMLAGCVPVVTRVGALSEVVGDAGEYVDDPSPDEVAAAVRRATAHPGLRRAAADRIRSEFPLAKRRERLLDLVHTLLARTFAR